MQSAMEMVSDMHDQSRNHLWYKEIIIYETHVHAFCDSAAKGIGDY